METNLDRPSAVFVVTVPITIKKRGGVKQILAPDGAECVVNRRPDGALIKAVARAFRWRKMLETGDHTTLADLAVAEKINPSYLSRILRLTLLAPDLVDAIINGRQPSTLTLSKAMEPFPLEWRAQFDVI